MQCDEIQQARVVEAFMMAARRYFGLAPAAPSVFRRRGPYSPLRPIFRSLLVVGSLGTVLAQPGFAMETMRPSGERDTTKSSPKREMSAVSMPTVVTLAKKLSRD